MALRVGGFDKTGRQGKNYNIRHGVLASKAGLERIRGEIPPLKSSKPGEVE
jgi:hypothetical protein